VGPHAKYEPSAILICDKLLTVSQKKTLDLLTNLILRAFTPYRN